MTSQPLRSRNWSGRQDLDGFLHRRLKAEGFSDLVFDGRPVIGICNSWSSHADLHARIDDPALRIDETSVLVLKHVGPRGAPGMPEGRRTSPVAGGGSSSITCCRPARGATSTSCGAAHRCATRSPPGRRTAERQAANGLFRPSRAGGPEGRRCARRCTVDPAAQRRRSSSHPARTRCAQRRQIPSLRPTFQPRHDAMPTTIV
jgi:hypothetical protein